MDHEGNKFPDNDEFVPYVLVASSLAQRQGAKIILWGRVKKVCGDGFFVQTVNEEDILIKLKKPVTEPLEGWVEVHGVSQGKSVMCEDYVRFPAEMTKNIDVEAHKTLAKLMVTLDDPWNLGDTSNEMQGDGMN